eukprot:TRINITY_DN2008_c0_g7_i2.p1 TRINITY_DN2008_c0_g7~~TRINITY_DN2008_c0_g7_i2.p1  ORF type:complete len:498 (-),score=90.39 TRINITY_DN2008_c0_g7_i2:2102-3595(-)
MHSSRISPLLPMDYDTRYERDERFGVHCREHAVTMDNLQNMKDELDVIRQKIQSSSHKDEDDEDVSSTYTNNEVKMLQKRLEQDLLRLRNSVENSERRPDGVKKTVSFLPEAPYMESQRNDFLREQTITTLLEQMENVKKRDIELHKVSRELEDLKRQLQAKCQELSHTQEELKNLRERRQRETITVENASKIEDNYIRLLELLGSTTEYKDFHKFYKDSDGLVRLPIKYRNIQELVTPSLMSKIRADTTIHINPKDEISRWIPESVAAVTKVFTGKYLGAVNPDVLAEFLVDLNKAYLEREKRHTIRLKTEFAEELQELKRRLRAATPSNITVLQQKVQHLKKELDKAHQAKRVANFGHDKWATLLQSSLNEVVALSEELKSTKSETHSPQSSLLCDSNTTTTAIKSISGLLIDIHSFMAETIKASLLLVSDLHKKAMNLPHITSDFNARFMRLMNSYTDRSEEVINSLRQKIQDRCESCKGEVACLDPNATRMYS